MALKAKTPAAVPEEKPADQAAEAPAPVAEPAPAPVAEPVPAAEPAPEPAKDPEPEPEAEPVPGQPKTVLQIVKELEANHGEFVSVTNDRKTAFRQASTNMWIHGGETKQLMNDGWLRNQVAARLFSVE